MPENEKKALVRRAKKAGRTISAYILHAVKVSETMISEDELVEMSKQAEKEYREGKTKTLRSLADLI